MGYFAPSYFLSEYWLPDYWTRFDLLISSEYVRIIPYRTDAAIEVLCDSAEFEVMRNFLDIIVIVNDNFSVYKLETKEFIAET